MWLPSHQTHHSLLCVSSSPGPATRHQGFRGGDRTGWRLARIFSGLSFSVLRCRVPSGRHPPDDQPGSLTSVLQGRVGVRGDPGAQKPHEHPPVTLLAPPQGLLEEPLPSVRGTRTAHCLLAARFSSEAAAPLHTLLRPVEGALRSVLECSRNPSSAQVPLRGPGQGLRAPGCLLFPAAPPHHR